MDINEIGSRIKQARTLRNYTLDYIANEIGVAKSTIQRYENGLISNPKLPVLQAIADCLRVNPAWLSGKDVPMLREDSLSSIINNKLQELNISLEYVSQKANVSLYWLQNIDTFIPGQFGDDEIGYEWITRVSEVLEIPSSILRTALAKQEIPVSDDVPKVSAKEIFKTPFSSNPKGTNEFPPEIRAAARGMMELSPSDQKTAIDMINYLSQKGKEAKDN